MARTTPAQKPRGWARMTRISVPLRRGPPPRQGRQYRRLVATQQSQFPASGPPEINPYRPQGCRNACNLLTCDRTRHCRTGEIRRLSRLQADLSRWISVGPGRPYGHQMGHVGHDQGRRQRPLSACCRAAIAASAAAVDAALERVLPQPAWAARRRVQEAMRYATFAGGKRLRPFLVLHSARLFGVDDARSLAGRARPSRCCTPIRWCMTICPAWTTTICAAAGPPPISPLTR